MSLEVGSIVEGKVSGITNFGAFVDLPGGETGMVHISEVAPTFVNEIREFVKEGEEVKVKILSVCDEGKISLSMKQAMENSNSNNRSNNNNPRNKKRRFSRPRRERKPAPEVTSPGDFEWQHNHPTSKSNSFEEMLTKFKQTSEDKMTDLKRGGESRGYSRRGTGNSR